MYCASSSSLSQSAPAAGVSFFGFGLERGIVSIKLVEF
jgi:hypothetical protein